MMTVTQSKGQVVQIDYSQANTLEGGSDKTCNSEEMNTVLGFEDTDGINPPTGVLSRFLDRNVDSTLFDAQFCYDIKNILIRI